MLVDYIRMFVLLLLHSARLQCLQTFMQRMQTQRNVLLHHSSYSLQFMNLKL